MQLATCVKAAPLQLIVRELFLASGLLDRRIIPVDFNSERCRKRALKLNQDQVLGPFFILGVTSSPLTSFQVQEVLSRQRRLERAVNSLRPPGS